MNFTYTSQLNYWKYKLKRLDAQGLKFYKSPYKYGMACFTYREGSNAYIYEGNFLYEHAYNNFGKALTRISGRFKDNKKEGVWTYKNQEARSKTLLTCTYVDGVHQGEYTIKTYYRRFLRLHLTRILKVTLLNNKVIGPVKVVGSTYTIQANCDENGRPDGEWFMDIHDKNNQYKHVETWNHGVLEACYNINRVSGSHEMSEEKIRPKIMQIVRDQAYGLECRIGDKQTAWSGSIHRNI